MEGAGRSLNLFLQPCKGHRRQGHDHFPSMVQVQGDMHTHLIAFRSLGLNVSCLMDNKISGNADQILEVAQDGNGCKLSVYPLGWHRVRRRPTPRSAERGRAAPAPLAYAARVGYPRIAGTSVVSYS